LNPISVGLLPSRIFGNRVRVRHERLAVELLSEEATQVGLAQGGLDIQHLAHVLHKINTIRIYTLCIQYILGISPTSSNQALQLSTCGLTYPLVRSWSCLQIASMLCDDTLPALHSTFSSWYWSLITMVTRRLRLRRWEEVSSPVSIPYSLIVPTVKGDRTALYLRTLCWKRYNILNIHSIY
jgi:hypothetical protein